MVRISDRPRAANIPGDSEPSRDDALILALVALTFTTGLVDAVSYIGFGRVFVANMTGNVALLGFAAAGVPGLSVTRALLSLLAFLLGAAAGGRLEIVLAGENRRNWLLSVGVLETALIVGVALGSVDFEMGNGTPANRLYLMILLSALAMGLRNATVRSLKVRDLSTTVVTLTLTGLAADSSLGGGNNPRLLRRLASVVVLFAGAATGAFLLRYGLALPLFVTAGCVLSTSIVYAAIAGRKEPERSVDGSLST
jgi:uncharacterized membrane protein YoaK (UPF0700 family)